VARCSSKVGCVHEPLHTYQNLLDRKSLKPRIYPATDDGTRDGNPVLLTPEAWEITKRDQPTNVLAAQMLQNPAAGNEAMFKREWLKFLDIRPSTLTVGIMCDPASSRKKGSDDTVIHVWGMDTARNRFLLDGYHHKMGLTERWQRIKELRKKWADTPGVQMIKVGYERYGSTSDLEYFTERMEIEKDFFEIVELAWPLEGPGSKYDRIQRLEPDFRQGKIYLAAALQVESPAQEAMRAQGQEFRIYAPTRRIDQDGNIYNLNKKLLDEYLVYPYSAHDDGLDTASRWNDMDMHPPEIIDERDLVPDCFVDGS
jgi:phage terminase large subunit-like protein